MNVNNPDKSDPGSMSFAQLISTVVQHIAMVIYIFLTELQSLYWTIRKKLWHENLGIFDLSSLTFIMFLHGLGS